MNIRTLAILFTLAISSPLHAAPDMVTLVAKDGTKVQLTMQAARLSGFIRKIVDADATHIQLPGLHTGDELHRLVSYLNIMVALGEDMPEQLVYRVGALGYLNELITLLNNANYLGVPALIHASAYCIADMVSLNNSEQVEEAIDAEMHTVVAHYLLTRRPMVLGNNPSVYFRIAQFPLVIETEDLLYTIKPENVPPNRQAIAWAATEGVVTARKSLDGTKVALFLRNGSLDILELQRGTYNTITKLGPSPLVAYLGTNIPIHKTLVRWSDDGHKLVTTVLDFVQVYEKIDDLWQKTSQFSSEAKINDVVWDDAGNTLIFATQKSPIVIHEFLHGQWLCTAKLGLEYQVAQRVWLCPTGETVRALSLDDTVRVWRHRRPGWPGIPGHPQCRCGWGNCG